jgi:hypothetical protein
LIFKNYIAIIIFNITQITHKKESNMTSVSNQNEVFVAYGQYQSLADSTSNPSSPKEGMNRSLQKTKDQQTKIIQFTNTKPGPLTDREILVDHYKKNPSCCNTILCGNCEEPSCCLKSDCCDCCLTRGNNVIILDAPHGHRGSDGCGDCGGGDCGGCDHPACCVIAAFVLAATGACIAGYQTAKTINQVNIINDYNEKHDAPNRQEMKLSI